MVGNSWTTPEQRAYLKLNLPQYEAAQASKKTTLYADELCLRFLNKFREYWDRHQQYTSQHRKKGKCISYLCNNMALTGIRPSQRVKAWLNNHSGPRNRTSLTVAKIHTSRSAPRDPFRTVLSGGGANRPKQKLQPKQAYSVLNWRDGKCLKTLVDSEWKKKIKEEPELTPKDYLAYRNMRLDQLLAAESPEVKAEVEEYRNRKDTHVPAVSPLLHDDEEDLPEDEKDQLVEYRAIQRVSTNSY